VPPRKSLDRAVFLQVIACFLVLESHTGQSNYSLNPDHPEALDLDLLLCRGDRGRSVWVLEATSLLAVLERCSLRRAHALALAVVGAACGAAVSVAHTAARNELGTGAKADILGACNVWSYRREGGGGDLKS
jgi:hypothetical protein